MLGPSNTRFSQAAIQSGLIDEAGLQACWDAVPLDRRTPDAIDRRMARQAIASKRLTLWQAQQLLAGRVTGFRIDKYLLLDLLGRGGMGRVFLARDVRLDRTVAIKMLSQERMGNPRAIARFRREAKVGAQLQHDNLVRVYDEGENGGILYLVMEHIDGKNVAQLIGDLGQIAWPDAAKLGRQVALGLDHARLKGLIHRDVNPCNILVAKDGVAKLTDLGLAIDLNDLDNVTREGATVGTFDYVSPEQAKNSRSVDTRSDLYSLGCSLYHMIAGQVPFPMGSLPEKLYAHQLRDPDPLGDLAPGTPEGLVEVIRRMMRKSPDERFQTPAEVAAALEPFAVESAWTTGNPSSASTPAIGAAREAANVNASGPGARRSGSGESPTSPGPAAGESPSANAPWSITPAAEGESLFALDLGPAEPLTSGLAGRSKRSRGWGRSTGSASDAEIARAEGPEAADPKAGPKAGPDGRTPQDPEPAPAPSRPRNLRVPALVGLGLAAVLAAAGVWAAWPRKPAGPADPGVPRSADGNGAEGADGAGSTPTGLPTVTGSGAIPLAGGDVVVRFRDGKSEAAPNLAEAMSRAVRDRAEVIIAAGSKVRIANTATARVPGGGLTIRGAGGHAPSTLEITIKGDRPLFLVDANLRLVGLTVVVRHEGESTEPVWRTERELTIDHCVFRADDPARGRRLFLAEGKALNVSNSLFAGFDRPIEVAAGPGTSVKVSQSIFFRGEASAESPPSNKEGDDKEKDKEKSAADDAEAKVLGGSALLVRSSFGGGEMVKVRVDHCSAWFPTFLESASFSASAPLGVEVTGSAIRAGALLATDGGPAFKELAALVDWKGKGNALSVVPEGAAWWKLAGDDKAEAEGAPTTLDAWSKDGREADPRPGPIRFARGEAPTSTATVGPGDLALQLEDGKPVGADPAQVGPR